MYLKRAKNRAFSRKNFVFREVFFSFSVSSPSSSSASCIWFWWCVVLRGMLVAFSSDNFCFNVVLKCLFGFCWLWLVRVSVALSRLKILNCVKSFRFSVRNTHTQFFFHHFPSACSRVASRRVWLMSYVCACASAYVCECGV